MSDRNGSEFFKIYQLIQKFRFFIIDYWGYQSRQHFLKALKYYALNLELIHNPVAAYDIWLILKPFKFNNFIEGENLLSHKFVYNLINLEIYLI